MAVRVVRPEHEGAGDRIAQRSVAGAGVASGPFNDPAHDVFGPGGLMARHLPGWEHRPEQERMCAAVARAIAQMDVCLVEAGTGVGKTLAYLAPAILSGRKVVVATGTKALMEQVRGKEVPFLGEALGIPFTSAVLKGRSNYLCRARLDALWSSPGLFDAASDRRGVARLRKWAQTTIEGDFAELDDLAEGHPLTRRLGCHADGCTGRQCSHYTTCFLYLARARAQQVDVVLTNHHLFFADLVLGDAEGGAFLPPDATVILDEAHGLEDVATEYFGMSISAGELAELARDTQALAAAGDPTAGRLLTGAAARLVEGFGAILRHLLPREGRSRVDPEMVSPEALKCWHLLDLDLEGVAAQAHEIAYGLERDSDVPSRATSARAVLTEVMSGADAGVVRLADRKGLTSGTLSALPIDVSGALRERVFLTGRPIVLTSATLTVDGSTAFMKGRLGVPEGASEEILASPFDYARQAVLYVPTSMPEPGMEGHPEAFDNEVERLLNATKGRAFVLFTSHAALQRSAVALRPRLAWPILVQGEMPRDALVKKFKSTPHACLFGTATFWEGVDVAGDALSCVIVDRLPFDPPDDPLVQARAAAVEASGENPFRTYQVPLAVIRLRQGFGRLIRRRSDKGVVAVLDVRLRKRPYGKVFLRSLPPAPLVGDIADVEAWCRKNLRKARG